MALDVYVGPLTRFYTGRWKSIISQIQDGDDPSCFAVEGIVGRCADFQVNTEESQGQIIEVKSNRKNLPPSAVAGREIEAWRQALNETFAAHLEKPLDWPEDEEGGYFTDKLGWQTYGALMLWAAHEEHPEFELPDRLPEDWASDPAYELSQDEQTPTRYPTLFRSDFWLPGELSFTAKGRAPNGTEVTFGSSTALIGELLDLNARTWGTGEIAEWFAHGKTTEDGLEDCAKFAFAVLLAMARFARHDSLPMVLDW